MSQYNIGKAKGQLVRDGSELRSQNKKKKTKNDFSSPSGCAADTHSCILAPFTFAFMYLRICIYLRIRASSAFIRDLGHPEFF